MGAKTGQTHGRDHRPGGSDYAGGIYFDVTPQTSASPDGFLVATTTGAGIQLSDSSTGSVALSSAGGQVSLSAAADGVSLDGGYINLNTSGGGISLIDGGGGDIDLETSSDGDINISADGALNLTSLDTVGNGIFMHSAGEMLLLNDDGPLQLWCSDPAKGIQLRIEPGQNVHILEQGGPNQIFRFEYGGDLHMKSGATIIYDL